MQVPAKRGGGKRETARVEALALLLAALGAANRWTGVTWKNTQDASGNNLAVAVIPGARFDNKGGKTTLAIHQ